MKMVGLEDEQRLPIGFRYANFRGELLILEKKVKEREGSLEMPLPSLKLTASSPLKMDGWNSTFLLGEAYFQVRTVSFRGCN